MNRVLFVSPVAFSGLHQRHQSLAGELARRGWQVCFVDPLKTGGFSCTISKAAENLKVVRLRVPFKGNAWPAFQAIVARLALLLLKTELAPHTGGDVLLWIAEPSLAHLSRRNWPAIVYDRCDLHGFFPGQNWRVWQKYEELLFARATLISCSHPYLKQSLPEVARNKSVLAGNACADVFFEEHKFRQPVGSHLKLVSAGAHHEWVDSRWLEMLCNHGDIELHLAGIGRGSDYQKLCRHPRVIHHGELDRSALAELFKTCDVGLVAFKEIELIKGVDPIKAYEYAASGLEIWSPPVASLRENPLINRVIGCSSELEHAVSAFRRQPRQSPGNIVRWSDRLQTILDRLTVLRSD
ncbi:MAG: hypothetical protein KKB51_04795 [Candidatus Riflebacteria bacterium]|nr:hypothetical protein [Candidatus Riflebacteria bacterium]